MKYLKKATIHLIPILFGVILTTMLLVMAFPESMDWIKNYMIAYN